MMILIQIIIILGGSRDVSYFNGLAALTATNAQVGMVMISAQLSGEADDDDDDYHDASDDLSYDDADDGDIMMKI